MGFIFIPRKKPSSPKPACWPLQIANWPSRARHMPGRSLIRRGKLVNLDAALIESIRG
jgi:hypothetical protein